MKKSILQFVSIRLAIGLELLSLAFASHADSPKFQLPLKCDFSDVCHIQNHFDHQSGPGFADYACGSLGYDGHDGTDLRLPNLAYMRRGVEVTAAASGVIRAIRDDMPDVNIRDINLEAIKGREAGNAVVIKHGQDWETQYSHLRKGSVRVQAGDSVEAGQVLGLVGLSGKSEFPHLHFEVRYRGTPVDPFTGLVRSNHCGIGNNSLWAKDALTVLGYRPTGVLQAGFAAQAPLLKTVEQGEYDRTEFTRDAPALVFWVEAFGARTGDQGLLQLFGPDGRILAEKKETFSSHKARWFSYAGRKRPAKEWPAGPYLGRYRILRESGESLSIVINREFTLTVR